MKKFFSIIILTVILFNFSGCYDARGVEELAYAVAIGLDITDNNELELTLQFATSGESSSGDSSGSSSQSKETNITTIKCSSISSGISLINNHISKQVNLSHCQVILLSEKLAAMGVSKYMDTFFNNVELLSDCRIIVTRCKAKDYLNNVQPALENLTARYYESSLNSAEYTGYTVDITLAEFYSKMKDSYCETYATLGTTMSKDDASNSIKINADYVAGENPITDKDVIDTLGIAVFHGDKLVGELTGLDSICQLIITNELDECTLSIPSPFKNGDFIDLALTPEKKTKCSVSIINSTPYISVEVFLLSNGLSLDDYTRYDSEEALQMIEQSASKYLKNQISSYLYKTSKDYRSDVCGFGKYAVKNYLTIGEWHNSDWLNNYQNSFFDVNVTLNVKSRKYLWKILAKIIYFII